MRLFSRMFTELNAAWASPMDDKNFPGGQKDILPVYITCGQHISQTVEVIFRLQNPVGNKLICSVPDRVQWI